MDCITFNKDIDAFINERLDDEELNDFLNHLKTCAGCAEELEVNYIVKEGMVRLDDKKSGLNLASAHRHNLKNNQEYIASRKRLIILSDIFRTLSFWVVFAAAIVFLRTNFG